jgi:uncharacterized membrane protein YuzA (DUF378 family)
MVRMTLLDQIAGWIILVGGLNWGLAYFNKNLFSGLFIGYQNYIYLTIGIASIYFIYRMINKFN